MKSLMVHSDYIVVESRSKAIKEAEEIDEKTIKLEEVLVVFVAVEAGDLPEFAKKLADDIEDVLKQVKAERVLLYPLVHLTSKPGSPRTALKTLKQVESYLKEKGIETKRAPFGWYKAYTLKCKGHPLSELSRTYEPGKEIDEISASLKAEEKVKSEFFILTPKGELIAYDQFDYSAYPNLQKLVNYETKKNRVYDKEPDHIQLMKKHGLVDYEPGSDPGNLRWLPKGKVIKKLLEAKVTDICLDAGAMEVETPIMYDFEHPSLKKYLNRFPARQYIVLSDDKKLFLRFAACFGQFLISHDLPITYKQLPLKLYELTHYSFRREQRGELVGLKRLRAFTMPDMHTFAKDFDQARKEFEKQYELSLSWQKTIGIDTEVAFRVQKDFFEEHKDWYVAMVKKIGKPAMFEIFNERYAYFITKFEFNFIDGMDKATSLSTVQIDVENAETYDISYVDEDNKKKRPLILHASISGAIDRVLYAILEKQAMEMKKGNKGQYPLWLAPIQVRLIPVSKELVDDVKFIAKRFPETIRVDVDDREESLSKKVRNAQVEWIPYIVVVGEQELKEGKLSVTVRATNQKTKMTVEQLIEEIEEKTKGLPKAKRTFPMCMSKRPI